MANITYCDCCKNEVCREIQPQGMWRDITDESIVCMCQTCIQKTNDFIRSLYDDTVDYYTSPVTKESTVEVVEEAEVTVLTEECERD